jgi:putative ATP-binding cassette transporter
MAVKLLRFLYRETRGKARIVTASLASGLSRGILLATFNAAAAAGIRGSGGSRLLAAEFAAALAVYLASTYISMHNAQRAVETMIERLRVRLCAKLLLTQLRFLEKSGTGDLYTQLSADLNRLSGAAITFLAGFQAIVLLSFALIYLAWLSPIAFLATITTIIVGVSVHFAQDREARRNLVKARERQSAFFDIINDLLRGFKELKLTRARRDGLMGHLSDVAGEYRELTVKAETLFLLSMLTSQTFTFVLIGILVFALPAVFPTQSTVIFQFLSTILFLIGPVETLASSVPSIARARVALSGIEVLEAQLDTGIAAEAPRIPAPAHFRQIEFRDVHYRFQGAEPEDEFDVGPIDLDIHRGEIVFFVGGNGAGKTTFLKLLSGLYQPLSGTIAVDGKSVTAADQQSYREMFGAVFGDFHLFRRLYGVRPPDPETVELLLSELQLDSKTKLRDGELTTIHLSSGQRKRLAYAVTRFLDRPIYVFDEFAADQDPAFRRYFYTSLLPQLRASGKTVVVVTHDERWFSVADRVVKMEYGRIAEIIVHDAARADMPTI